MDTLYMVDVLVICLGFVCLLNGYVVDVSCM